MGPVNKTIKRILAAVKNKFIKNNWAYLVILVAAGFFLYAFNFHNQLFWDDTDWIVNNPFVHEFSWENIKNLFTKNTLAGIGLTSNYYRPFLFITFLFNYILDGINPIGYHLINNLLHIGNGILIYWLLYRIFKNKFIPFWTALFFIIHPLQTEAVTYVAGRGDPLNVFFMLSALALILAYRQNQRRLFLYFSYPLVSLALLSRETAIIFPFLLMILDISFLRSEKFWQALKKSFLFALPYFLIVFIYGLMRLTVLNFENTLNFYQNPNPYSESLLIRMYTFLSILILYLKLMILPLGLHMERSATVFGALFYWQVFLPLIALVTSLIFLRRLYRNRSPGKISGYNVMLFGFGWFFINLGPTSGITPINATQYEHWLYLALAGPLVMLFFFLNRFMKAKKSGYAIIVILLAAGVFFSFLTIKRNILWGNPIKFYEDILKYEPASARINNNLGNFYYDKNETKKAEDYYWKAVSVEDNFPQPHFNLGSILQDRGDIRGAIVEFEKAIEIDPNFPYAYQNLAVIYAAQGDLAATIKYLEKFRELQPQNPRAYYNLALVYLAVKDKESAYKNLNEGLLYGRYDPETEKLIRELLNQLKS